MTQLHYIPLNTQPFYNRKALKNSNIFYQHCLNLPIYTDLTSSEKQSNSFPILISCH